MAATDLRRQFLAKDSQLLPIWRANVRREVAIDGGSAALWREENQLRKLGGAQSRETAANIRPTEGQAAVAVETVPAQIGDIEKFAPHGLHWVPEQRLYFTNLDWHIQSRPPNASKLRCGPHQRATLEEVWSLLRVVEFGNIRPSASAHS